MTSRHVVGVVMGSDATGRSWQAAADALDEFDVPYEVRRRLGAPHARPDAGVRARRGRPRHAGDHRRRRRRRAPAGDGGRGHTAAGDRGAGAAGAPRRDGLAAVDRADAGGRAGGHGVDRRGAATPGCWRCGSWRRPTPRLRKRMQIFQDDLEAQVLAKDRALRERLLGE